MHGSWLLLSVLHAGVATAQAQAYPSRPIRLIIPWATGGSTDAVIRVLAPRMSETLGQQVIVDNRPGGASVVGLDAVAKAPPDGYTVGVTTISFGVNPFMIGKMPFETEKDFAPVSQLTEVPTMLVVHPSVPAGSIKELIAFAKSRPGVLNYGSAGNGTVGHLAAELFSYVTAIRMVQVPYKGGGPAVISIVGGETAVLFATIPSALAHVRSGRLVALGVTSSKRDPTLPDTPTIAEAGYPGFAVNEWQGLVVPAGTPRAIVMRLNQEALKHLALPDVKERLSNVGAHVVGSSPEEFAGFIRKELATWSKLIKETGIRAD
jgi:tripartite-type tricarboxylate transporter receptor subunit TctC